MSTLSEQGAMINAFIYLEEIKRNDIRINIEYSSSYYGLDWRVALSKSADGSHLSIEKKNENLTEAIADAYHTWRGQTAAMPEHRLNVLEHRPFNPSDPSGEEWQRLNKAEEAENIDVPLGIYYVIGQGFFSTEGFTKGETFSQKWLPRWADFPNKTLDEHRAIVADQIPY